MRHIYKCPYNDGVDCTKRPCPKRCDICGYNPIESEWRKGYIQAGGMVKLPDGRMYLHIKRYADK